MDEQQQKQQQRQRQRKTATRNYATATARTNTEILSLRPRMTGECKSEMRGFFAALRMTTVWRGCLGVLGLGMTGVGLGLLGGTGFGIAGWLWALRMAGWWACLRGGRG
jgi:hypothetical protein